MANFLDKVKVKTAVENTSKLDLSSQHITTANFMQFNVAWCKELVPRERVSVDMETFTRLAPLSVPTMGRAKINNRAFFVPFRTIFPGWNDFITDTIHVNGAGTGTRVKVPVISQGVLYDLFSAPERGYVEGATVGSDDFTYAYNNNSHARKFTPKGRQAKKILESLGYKVIPCNGLTNTYSALPLLALAKIYIDWYYPSAYAQDANYTAVEGLLKKDIGDLVLTNTDVKRILDFISTVNYDSDYFVSAWDNPNNPNGGASSAIFMSDPSNHGSTSNSISSNPSDLAPTLTMGDSGKLTTWAIEALKSLTDYMKRHQIVGARALDRYLARFGVQLSAEKLNRSVYIGTNSFDIQFGDIMSTASTDGAQLGDYAGKGIGYGNSNFDISVDEYGIMLIVSTIIPNVDYYQGIDRMVMHTDKLDFWTPEFDNLGTQAIAKTEVFVPTDAGLAGFASGSADAINTYSKGIFGWTPRYAEYKIGRSRLTGDFNLPSMNKAGDTSQAWHLMRTLDYTNGVDIVHNVAFVEGNDAGQYSRIFDNTDPDVADKFRVIHNFNVASWSPMKPLFDTYKFENKGKEVTEDVNGVKMN